MANPVIVNSPKDDSADSGTGFLLGMLIFILFVVLFVVFGIPYIRSIVGTSPNPQINVPDKINVNINNK